MSNTTSLDLIVIARETMARHPRTNDVFVRFGVDTSCGSAFRSSTPRIAMGRTAGPANRAARRDSHAAARSLDGESHAALQQTQHADIAGEVAWNSNRPLTLSASGLTFAQGVASRCTRQ
jgi:hypothetical protein